MKSFLSSVRFTRPSGPLSRQIIITLGMFVLGAVFGFLARFLDIHTQNLGNTFSQMSVWVFLGTVIAVLSPSPLRSGINVFVFCAGMLIVYYTYAHLSGGVYSMTFVTGWAVFSALSPLLGFVTWYGGGHGLISFVIDVGILLFMALCSIVLFDGIHLSDVVLMLATAAFLAGFSRRNRHR